MKPTGKSVAAAAVQAVGVGHTYDEMDCQAFVEYCVKQAGGERVLSLSERLAAEMEDMRAGYEILGANAGDEMPLEEGGNS